MGKDAIKEDGNGNIWATDQFGNVSVNKIALDKWVNYYPIYKDSITNIPEGATILNQPRSIGCNYNGRYAFVGVYGFSRRSIDSDVLY